MNREDTTKVLYAIVSVYPRQEVSNSTIDVWHMLIGHLTLDVALECVRQVLANSRWEPKPADILEIAARMSFTPEELPEPEAAWELVTKAHWMDQGSLGSLPDAVRQAVKGIGTLRDIQTCDNPEVMRSQFVKIYQSIQERKLRDARFSPEHHANVARLQATAQARRLNGPGH